MSTKSLRTELNNLKLYYNIAQGSKQSELKKRISLWNNLNAEKKQQFLSEESQTIIREYKNKFESFTDRIQRGKTEINNKIKSLKYPASMNKDAAMKAFGENQINTAYSFLNVPRKKNDILNAIKTALDMERIDFAFQVIENIVPENILKSYFLQPNGIDSTDFKALEKQTELNNKLTKEILENEFHNETSKELIQGILKILDTYSKKKDLTESLNDGNEISTIEEITSALEKQLNEGRERIGYYTRDEVQEMSQEEVQDDLEIVNHSMSQW